jgi:hypothetical protein
MFDPSSPCSYSPPSVQENLTVNAEETVSPDIERVTGNRRGALAALVAGSALGLAAMGGTSPVQAAKGKKGKKNKGSNNNPTLGSSLPSVRYVYTTTTFESGGVVTASAACPSGYLPIGAGIWSSIFEPVILSSLPQLESNSWEFELDGAQPQHQATVTAICLAASDDTTLEDTEHRTTRRKKGKRGRKK